MFDTSPSTQFPKFNNFLWVCWFLGKNLSNFETPVWKLHNPYCRNFHAYSSIQIGGSNNAYIEIELIILLLYYVIFYYIIIIIPVDSSLAILNLCNSKCAISSIKYIMRNPHITNISANGTLQDEIKKWIFERALSMTWFWKNKNPSYISF